MPAAPAPRTLSSPIKGDRSKRITVALPNSLSELEKHARTHFGGGTGKLKLYHRGEAHLEHPGHHDMVGHEDNIVVRRASNNSAENYPFNMTTTHQTAFVRHPMEERKPPPERALPKGPEVNVPKFLGRSCYSGDYVEHPLERRQKKEKPPPAYEPTDIPMTARSAYAESFPWHPTQPRTPTGPKTPGPGYDVNPPPFHGQSSYKIDYIKHKVSRPKSEPAGPRKPNTTKVEESPPFNGSTTYTNDYKKHASSPQRGRSTGTWKQEPLPSPKFVGNSEYQNQYIKKEGPARLIVHLEPELKD